MAGDIHQCPRCELRFAHTCELQDHFAGDHRADPETFARLRYPAASTRSPAGRRHVLVVANQTLADLQVLDELVDRTAGTCAYVLVPATSAADLAMPLGDRAPRALAAGDDVGRTLARWNLRTALARLRGAGIEADGEVGHPDPFKAVMRILPSRRVDEIVLATLPPTSSRWLRADLPTRLRRHCGRPVTVLTGSPAAATVG